MPRWVKYLVIGAAESIGSIIDFVDVPVENIEKFCVFVINAGIDFSLVM